MKRKGLGRGLDALMPEAPRPLPSDSVALIDIGDIDPNPNQPRRRFDQAALKELADSIRQVGVLSPILVHEHNSRYQIIAGERRWRASRMAELSEIPCIIRQVDDVSRLEMALIENLQREDLNPIEEAAGIRSLMDECGFTQDRAAGRLGRSRPALANLRWLLTLPKKIIAMVRDGRLSAGHARVLAGIDEAGRAEFLAERAIEEGWSVRQMEQMAQKEPDAEAPPKIRSAKSKPSEFIELEDRLLRAFGMRARVAGSLDKGKITLQYASREELEHLYEAIGEGAVDV
jgi:ParB family chromosome partitioning protein